MKRVVPIDANGQQIGPPKRVTNAWWDRMNELFGKRLRYRLAGEGSRDEIELMPERVSTTAARSSREDEVRKAYKEKYGRKAPKTWKLETIENKLKDE